MKDRKTYYVDRTPISKSPITGRRTTRYDVYKPEPIFSADAGVFLIQIILFVVCIIYAFATDGGILLFDFLNWCLN